MSPGKLYGVGLGPGDPELLTLKAARILEKTSVIAFFAKRDHEGHARRIAAPNLGSVREELRLEYPYTTELPFDDPRYLAEMEEFYARSARAIAGRLDLGLNVAVLCEGDPFFYGSFMYLHDRLAPAYESEIVPGITGMGGCWARARAPMTHGDDVLTVVPGTLDEDELAVRLGSADAAVVMKIGRNLPKVRAALARAGLAERAIYVERGTMADERILPLSALTDTPAPYFSIILVPGRQGKR